MRPHTYYALRYTHNHDLWGYVRSFCDGSFGVMNELARREVPSNVWLSKTVQNFAEAESVIEICQVPVLAYDEINDYRGHRDAILTTERGDKHIMKMRR